ncbi:MAG: LamG domain-containing protein [Bacteroidaceae bacterium]|nr:LamG domain-containing protein [Bacteroidaceae bacterium]
MKQKFYFLYLTALLCLAGGGMATLAQTPEPTGKWTFENTEDLMAPSVGNLALTPCLIPGNYTISPSTVSETGIVTADGPTEGRKAICVPKTAALKVSRAEGAETSTAYTIMMDFMVPDANPFNGLLQMDEANDHDGDLFTNKYQIGIGSLKYAGNVKDGKWYRVVFTYDESKPEGTQARLYLNGSKIAEGNANQRHIMQPFGFYVLCDEDGEKIDVTYLAEVVFWETPLTDEDVAELGNAVPTVVTEIATAQDMKDFAEAVNNGEEMNGVLTADIDLSGAWETPIGTSENAFAGTFDGQGHSITGFNYTSTTDGGGLFGYTSSANIKDFSIYGSLESTAGTGSGVIGYPSGSNISGIHSYLEISVPVESVHHVGGVVGSARGNNTITGCTFHGSMSVAYGSNDNFAGIVAYLGGDNVSFCANYGTINFDDPNCAAGGIAGYCNNTSSWVHNCLNMGAVTYNDPEETPNRSGAFVGWLRTHDPEKMKGNCWLEGSASSAGRDGATIKLETAFCFKEAQLATGEVCYNLNGDQSVIGWYQTLPEDEAPVLLDPTHKQVYKNGRLHCNGDPSEDTNFSNENLGTTQDDHNIVDGFCSYCGLFYPDAITPNADGFYEIANARQLCWFEQKVNTGNLTANAILIADIDFADLMPEGADPEQTEIVWTPIGDWGATRGVSSAGYQGHFDGQGHIIKNLNATSKQNFFGLFGVLSSNAIVENFDIYGTLESTVQYCGGVAGYARDINPTIRNIHSYVNINNTSAGGRQGGILGCAQVDNANYKTYIEGCTYSGTLDGNDAGGGGNYGGMVGYCNSNSNNFIDITNCLFDGEVVNNNPTPGGCTFGGFIGYSNSAVVTIKNCLSIGTVESAVWGQYFGAIKNTKSSMPNSYYIGEILNGSASTVTLTANETNTDELASGEICWKLNEETFVDAVWRQDLDEENYPKPTSKGAIVYQTPNGYDCISEEKPESLSSFINSVIANEEDFIEDENLVAYQVLIDEYKAAIESWGQIETFDAFMAAYKAAAEIKEAIKVSAANYAAYAKACEDAANYLKENSLEGQWADFLKTYLEEMVEPNSNYPNGSYAYIMDELNLDDEALAAEVDFVDQMLENAIAGGITPGTEITRLMINPTFAEDYEGWTVEADGGTATVEGVRDVMPIPEGYNNQSFSASQTLTELPNGIYMMSMNGLFRAGTDIYSQFYAGQLYLNDTYNYFMSPGEDAISADEAEDQVNCDLSSDAAYSLDGIDGWVPNVRKGCSYAFKAGRYQNFVATEVTDGTLTVGVRNQGTGLAKDWLPFGNVHVWYLGTAQEANKKLNEVLDGYVARAQVIVDFAYSEYEDFAQYPNISEDLKDQLSKAIAATKTATTGEEKMALINRFSALFNEVHACRKAYITMLDTANKLYDFLDVLDATGAITSDEYNEFDALITETQNHYTTGDVSAEEALAIAAQLNIVDKLMPQVDGVYQLADARSLLLFSLLVNEGQDRIDAALTADIDLSELIPEEDKADADPSEVLEIGWTPIGKWGDKSAAYRGHFDGQGHTIKNLNATSNQNFFGLFGVISDGAVIENFTIYGNINATVQYVGGTVGYSRDTETVIRNVHSYVNIYNISAGARQGGILGTAQNGKATVEGCTYSGTLDGNDASGSGNYGGIIGYVNNSSAAIAIINNCLFDGEVVNNNAAPGNCTFGGIVGYNNSGTVTIKNCLSIGTVRSARASQFFGALNGNNSTFENNYYLGANINGPGSGGTAAGPAPVKVTTEQLASGEVCFKLNGDDEVHVWYQTLFTDETHTPDAYPVLDPAHETVLFIEGLGYYNANDPDGINEVGDEQLTIDNAIYNLAGQRINKLQKGINIVNGKKILY